MDAWAPIAGLAVIIGIVASIVQVLDYADFPILEISRPAQMEPYRSMPIIWSGGI
jgi:hypothetical protein